MQTLNYFQHTGTSFSFILNQFLHSSAVLLISYLFFNSQIEAAGGRKGGKPRSLETLQVAGAFFVTLHEVDDHVAWWSLHPFCSWLPEFLSMHSSQ
jgi:hypothetical protein